MGQKRFFVPCALLLASTSARAGEAQSWLAERGPVDRGPIALRAPSEGRVLIRAGTFTMGSEIQEIATAVAMCRAELTGVECEEQTFTIEYAPHPVYLDDYWIDRLEVAMGDYRRCSDVGPCSPVPLAGGGRRFDRPSLPASMVTWNDAATYCKWVGGRLPTEAEWERAARGLKGRRYPWGSAFDLHRANGGRSGIIDRLEARDGFLEAAPVGSFPEGATPDGIRDLSGNVEEWVSDWFEGQYPENSQVNPQGPDSGEAKVVRGGSFRDARASLRGASRDADLPSSRRPWRGFRCAQPTSKN